MKFWMKNVILPVFSRGEELAPDPPEPPRENERAAAERATTACRSEREEHLARGRLHVAPVEGDVPESPRGSVS